MALCGCTFFRKDSSKDTKISEVRPDSVRMDDDDIESNRDSGSSSPCCLRVWSVLSFIYKILSSVVGLCILLVLFTIIGAVVFEAIERPHEEEIKQNSRLELAKLEKRRDAERKDLISSVFNVTASFNVLNETAFRVEVERLLIKYEQSAGCERVDVNDEYMWDFWTALFFCGTIYTTIGYGNVYPTTSGGQVAAMIYACFGIPLMFIVLKNLGQVFTIGIKLMWAFVRRYYYTGACRKVRKHAFRRDSYEIERSDEKQIADDQPDGEDGDSGNKKMYGYEVDDEFNLPISVATIILVVYIFLGAMMYSLWEEWPYLKAFYFVFVSVSTIGFGDVLPAHTKYFIISSVYLFIGLALVSMVINTAIEFFSETADKMKDAVTDKVAEVGEKFGFDIDELQSKGSSKEDLTETDGKKGSSRQSKEKEIV